MGQAFLLGQSGGGDLDLLKFSKTAYFNGNGHTTREVDLSLLGEGLYILTGNNHYNSRSSFKITSPSDIDLSVYSTQAVLDAMTRVSMFVVLAVVKNGSAYDVYALGKTYEKDTKYLLLSNVTSFTFRSDMVGYAKLDYKP